MVRQKVKIELLVCPFCGKKPKVEYNNVVEGKAIISCPKCLIGQLVLYPNLLEAGYNWNRRF